MQTKVEQKKQPRITRPQPQQGQEGQRRPLPFGGELEWGLPPFGLVESRRTPQHGHLAHHLPQPCPPTGLAEQGQLPHALPNGAADFGQHQPAGQRHERGLEAEHEQAGQCQQGGKAEAAVGGGLAKVQHHHV